MTAPTGVDETMKIQVVSDVHAEVDPQARHEVVDLGADLVIVAGDVDAGGAGVRWAAETWPNTPVIYVMGNHEPYGGSIEIAWTCCQVAAAGTNVHVLEREVVTIAGVRILGATLWTDLALAGDVQFTEWRLKQDFPDYREIMSNTGRRLRPAETAAIHRETVAWLEDCLATAHDGPTVVVTHHAPSPRSLLKWDEWAGDLGAWRTFDAAFASDLEWLIRDYAPALWVHGHTHMSCDYWIGPTRVVSNQIGYHAEASGWDATYTVEVP